MKSEQFLQNVLQLGREKAIAPLKDLIRQGLEQQREMVRPMLENLLTRGNLRDPIVQVLVEDGGEDLLPMMMGVVEMERDREGFEKRLLQIGDFANPMAIDLLEVLHQRVTPKSEKVWRRAHGKLRARFRQHFYSKAFQTAHGEDCAEVARFMYKFPSDSYREPLLQGLVLDDLIKFRVSRKALVNFGEPQLLPRVRELLNAIQERLKRAKAFGELSFVKQDQQPPGRLLLLRTLGGSPWTPFEVVGAAQLNETLRNPSKDAKQLLAPFQLGPPIGERAQLYLQIILEQRGAEPPGSASLRDGLQQWLDALEDTFRESLFDFARLGTKLGQPDIIKQLEACIPSNMSHLQPWLLAGVGSPSSQQQLLQLLRKAKTGPMKEAILKALAELDLATIDDLLLVMARDTEDHQVRRLALELIARHPDAPTHLEQLLLHSPLLIKESVAQVMGSIQMDQFRPLLIGLLMRKTTDSFRLILLKALEAYDHMDTGLAATPFLRAPHTLPVRLAALDTLFKAGGPRRIQCLVDNLEISGNQRHRETIILAFLERLQTFPVESEEVTFLEAKAFLENLLHDTDATIRLATITLLERFSWQDEAREGWVGILQKAMQSLVSRRSEDEVERLRDLIATVSALFESERKHNALRSRLNNIMGGLTHHLRLERLQALKQLDWIFRPEMIAGDPDGVKRLVLRIENVMTRDEDDLPILASAIEIAGKIGHPVLRAKVREFLDHEEFSIANSAEKALARPVNQSLLDTMIETVFHMDDSQYMTRSTAQLLKNEGFDATGANDPQAAIEVLQKREYDLLILDLNMPKMRGLDFLRYIRRLEIAPRFTFVLTSVRNKDELIAVFKEGVDGILLKPFQADDLLEKIAELKARCC